MNWIAGIFLKLEYTFSGARAVDVLWKFLPNMHEAPGSLPALPQNKQSPLYIIHEVLKVWVFSRDGGGDY